MTSMLVSICKMYVHCCAAGPTVCLGYLSELLTEFRHTEEAWLLDYQQIYREADQTQVTKSAEVDALEGLEESDDDQGSKFYSRAQYDSDLGDKVPSDERVLVRPTSQTLNLIDFGDLPKFESLLDKDEVEMIQRRYPFCWCYKICVHGSDDRAHLLPSRHAGYLH